MFYLGYFFGTLVAGFYVWLGHRIFQSVSNGSPLIPEVINPKVFATRKIKKTPKAPSERDEWKKEQNAPPLDPGYE